MRHVGQLFDGIRGSKAFYVFDDGLKIEKFINIHNNSQRMEDDKSHSNAEKDQKESYFLFELLT